MHPHVDMPFSGFIRKNGKGTIPTSWTKHQIKKAVVHFDMKLTETDKKLTERKALEDDTVRNDEDEIHDGASDGDGGDHDGANDGAVATTQKRWYCVSCDHLNDGTAEKCLFEDINECTGRKEDAETESLDGDSVPTKPTTSKPTKSSSGSSPLSSSTSSTPSSSLSSIASSASHRSRAISAKPRLPAQELSSCSDWSEVLTRIGQIPLIRADGSVQRWKFKEDTKRKLAAIMTEEYWDMEEFWDEGVVEQVDLDALSEILVRKEPKGGKK